MSTSAIPATIAYLVSSFTAAATLGAATPAVQIIDGGRLTAEPYPLSLLIGTNDPDGTAFLPEAATSTQNWVGPGNRKRDEHISILCCAEAWTGDETLGLAGVRTSAGAIVAAVEDLTRNDANLGGNILFTDPGVTNLVWKYGYTDRGPACRVMFSIDCFARIGA